MHSVQLWLVSPPLKCENHCVGFDFVSGTYFLSPLLRNHSNLTHNFLLEPRTLCNVHMSNAEIVRQIEIYNLAVETAISSDYLAPSGGIIIDCLHNVWRDWILHHRRKRHQKVDCDIACLERPRHIDHVVSPLRVAHED